MYKKSDFKNWVKNVRFLSRTIEMYSLLEGELVNNLSETGGDNLWIFFSQQFLKDNGWKILPLWEGDLRQLRLLDGTKIYLMDRVRQHCLTAGVRNFCTATIERQSWEFNSFSEGILLASRTLDLSSENPSDLFKLDELNVPNWGNNFYWPDNEQFIIYSNGDTGGFIASETDVLVSIVGLTYEYCSDRFKLAHSNLINSDNYVNAFMNFCDEINRN